MHLMSLISYIALSFGTCVQNLILKKVEKVQERALCFIYRTFESDYKSLLDVTECSFQYMDRLRAIVTEVYKAINGKSPEFLQDLFVKIANVHDLRDNSKIKLYQLKTMTYDKQSIKYVAGILWNSINVDITNRDNVYVFKRKKMGTGKLPFANVVSA